MATAFSQAALAEAKRALDKAATTLAAIQVKGDIVSQDEKNASESYTRELNRVTEQLRAQNASVMKGLSDQKVKLWREYSAASTAYDAAKADYDQMLTLSRQQNG